MRKHIVKCHYVKEFIKLWRKYYKGYVFFARNINGDEKHLSHILKYLHVSYDNGSSSHVEIIGIKREKAQHFETHNNGGFFKIDLRSDKWSDENYRESSMGISFREMIRSSSHSDWISRFSATWSSGD